MYRATAPTIPAIVVGTHTFTHTYTRDAAGGLALWEARPDVFPDGMAAAAAGIGDLPTTMHNRWFDPATECVFCVYWVSE